MIDFAAARRTMVDCQVRPADVTDLRLIAAMGDLPREVFVPANKADLSYLDLDRALPAQADGSRQADPDCRDRGIRPRARCRLRHRLLVGGAGAIGGFGGRA